MPARKRLGAYTGETNVFNKKRTANTRMGGMRSAAYHRAGSRHRDMREKRSHIPSSPSTILARVRQARHGPRSLAGNIKIPVNFGKGSWRTRCGAATARAPIQEIANVSTK